MTVTMDPARPGSMPEPDDLPTVYNVGLFTTGLHIRNQPVEYEDGGRRWRPGDPIYHRGSGNYVRRIISLRVDQPWAAWVDYWCRECDVCWRAGADADKPEPCWFCGRPTPGPDDQAEKRARNDIIESIMRWVTP